MTWKNLEERVELLRHLKVLVPFDINLVETGRTKENQTGSHILKENVLANEAANLHKVFSIMFLLIGTDQRS